MRLKPVLAAASVTIVLGVVGCSSSDSPEEVESSATTSDRSDTTASEVVCPTQFVVDSVNGEFDKVGTDDEADVEGAYEAMGEYVPAELQTAFETVRDAAVEAAGLFEGLDPNLTEEQLSPSERADFEEARDLMTSDEVEEAQDALKEYFREECPDIVWSEERDSTTTTTTSGGGSSGDCPTQAEIEELGGSLGEMEGIDGEQFAEAVIAAVDLMDSYLPSEYDADIAVLKVAYAQFAEAIAGVDIDNLANTTPEQQAAFLAASAVLDSPEVTAAQERTEAYFEATCPDIDFD